MIKLKDIYTEATSDGKDYYYSIDGKTIAGPETLKGIGLLLKLKWGKGSLGADTFTAFDLKSGVSKKLTFRGGKKFRPVWIGQKLKSADFKKQPDTWGSLK